jgi:polysaccharide deacetylase family protein (PEP-CTERM system associated)
VTASNLQRTIDQVQTKKALATFFVLGWIAEKLPHLVREIHVRGHEVASHGNNHELCGKLSANELKKDLIDSKKMLENIIGMPVTGYRAPSFSINDDILKTLQDCGYLYDSSYNSFGMHGRYGKISLNGTGRIGIARKISENFFELPVSNLQLGGWTFPLGGGGYFRLLPTPFFTLGIKAVLKRQDSYLFYAHPWEFDPNQPRVEEASSSFKFRHYVNLKGAQSKLKKLIGSFSDCRFVTCREYLNTVQGFEIPK